MLFQTNISELNFRKKKNSSIDFKSRKSVLLINNKDILAKTPKESINLQTQ